MLFVIFASVSSVLCLVIILLGCLNCFGKKKPAGFSNFQNASPIRSPSTGQTNDAFTMEIPESGPQQAEQPVVIEPLPDIVAKTMELPSLRPRMMCLGAAHDMPISLNVQKSFPRKDLMFLNEVAAGWYGKAIESEALRISGDSLKSRVVVKMLKDDASKVEQKQFLDEVNAFRVLDHANLLKLLGQCTETAPYLTILEFAPHGDLKTYLMENRHDAESLIKKNQLISFILDICAGLSCMHRNDFIHNDLAARNCVVMADQSVKIGDYGTADVLYKEDYFPTGKALLPIRWMAPESLSLSEGEWSVQGADRTTDMWSLGVLMWEVLSLGERPYAMLSDEAVLQAVVLDRMLLPQDIDTRMPFKDHLTDLLSRCWTRDFTERPDIEEVTNGLSQLVRQRVDTIDTMSDFDHKWMHLQGNRQARGSVAVSETGSRVALAGSFMTQNSSSPGETSIMSETAAAENRTSPPPTVAAVHDSKPSASSSSTTTLNIAKIQNPAKVNADQKLANADVSIAIDENELSKINSSQNSIDMSFSSSAKTTSTPKPQINEDSTSQFYSMEDSSKNSTYATAVESPSELPITTDLSADFGQDLSLLSQDSQMTNTTLQKPILSHMNSNPDLITDLDDDLDTDMPPAASNDSFELLSSPGPNTLDISNIEHDKSANDGLQEDKSLNVEMLTSSPNPKQEQNLVMESAEMASSQNSNLNSVDFLNAGGDNLLSEPGKGITTNAGSPAQNLISDADDFLQMSTPETSVEPMGKTSSEGILGPVGGSLSDPVNTSGDFSFIEVGSSASVPGQGASPVLSLLTGGQQDVVDALGGEASLDKVGNSGTALCAASAATSSKYECMSPESESGIHSHNNTSERKGHDNGSHSDGNFAHTLDSSDSLYSSNISKAQCSSSSQDSHGSEMNRSSSPVMLSGNGTADVGGNAEHSDGTSSEHKNGDDLSESDSEEVCSDTSDTSSGGSGKEYDCRDDCDLDTGQPPPSPATPYTPTASTNGDHLNSDTDSTSSASGDSDDEQALKIVSEMYLSKGVKSPRNYEIPPLETIPEDGSVGSVSSAYQSPVMTRNSSVASSLKGDDFLSSDGFEWDDFYGDPLDSNNTEEDSRLCDRQLFRDTDVVSEWSLEMDNASITSLPTGVLSDLNSKPPEEYLPKVTEDLLSSVSTDYSLSSDRAVDTTLDTDKSSSNLSDTDLLSSHSFNLSMFSPLSQASTKSSAISSVKSRVSDILSKRNIKPRSQNQSSVLNSSTTSSINSYSNHSLTDNYASSESVTSPGNQTNLSMLTPSLPSLGLGSQDDLSSSPLRDSLTTRSPSSLPSSSPALPDSSSSLLSSSSHLLLSSSSFTSPHASNDTSDMQLVDRGLNHDDLILRPPPTSQQAASPSQH